MAPKKQAGKGDKDNGGSEKQYKGVYKSHGLYRARIWETDKEVWLGHYSQPEEAAAAYDQASISLRGWDAACREGLNLPFSSYQERAEDLLLSGFQQVVQQLRSSAVQDPLLR